MSGAAHELPRCLIKACAEAVVAPRCVAPKFAAQFCCAVISAEACIALAQPRHARAAVAAVVRVESRLARASACGRRACWCHAQLNRRREVAHIELLAALGVHHLESIQVGCRIALLVRVHLQRGEDDLSVRDPSAPRLRSQLAIRLAATTLVALSALAVE